MSVLHPDKEWWTATEIAAAALPDLPGTQQNVEAMVKRQGWRDHPDHARKRRGRGGGWEYSWRLFPLRARRKLLKDAAPAPEAAPADNTDLHAYYEALPDTAKEKARERKHILDCVLTLERDDMTRDEAVHHVAREVSFSARTIWNWFALVKDAPSPSDWLYHLAPRHRASGRKKAKAECSKEFFELLKADYLRVDSGSFSASYERQKDWAEKNGKAFLTERTARRRMNEEVPRVTQVFAREGEAGLLRCFPPQTRDRTGMVAMEGVNADCHKMDVFVIWPGEDKPSRAQIVAFQDIYSGKILSWRVDRNPNKLAVVAAFGDMIEQYGIPKHCLFDNGREFANKWLTGGAPTRFRFKVRDEDPLGLLTLLGIKIHWATPGHGQAKPIERAFKDFADHIATDPRFSGAYVGNRPDAKPENYGERAIPIDEFIEVVGEGIARHNAREGRRSDTCQGRSFDQTFAESYAVAPITKATDEQRRLWLLGQEAVKLHATHGRAGFQGNLYWSAWMNEFAGKRVVMRFDPEDLHAGVYIYDLDGAFLGFAPCEQKVGFFDLYGAKEHSREIAQIKRDERRLLKKIRTKTAKDAAAAMASLTPDTPIEAEAKVVQIQRGETRPQLARVTRPEFKDETTPEEAAKILEFQKSFDAEKAQAAAAKEEEAPLDRFQRAKTLEAFIEQGGVAGKAELAWLAGYQQCAEYVSHSRMYDDFGDELFASK